MLRGMTLCLALLISTTAHAQCSTPGCAIVPDGRWATVGNPGQRVCWVWVVDPAPHAYHPAWYEAGHLVVPHYGPAPYSQIRPHPGWFDDRTRWRILRRIR